MKYIFFPIIKNKKYKNLKLKSEQNFIIFTKHFTPQQRRGGEGEVGGNDDVQFSKYDGPATFYHAKLVVSPHCDLIIIKTYNFFTAK